MPGSPVLVGEVNPYSDRPFAALLDVPAGASGDRLRRLVMGVETRRYRAWARYDLCVGTFTPAAARERADELAAQHRDDVIIVLGRKVADAFGLNVPPFTYCRALPGMAPLPGTGAFVVLPHPSGRNSTWGDPRSFARARKVLAEALPGVPWGESLAGGEP